MISRYLNSQTTIPSTLTTLDEGGACHMGRAANASTPTPGNCTLLEKTSDYFILYCNGHNVTLQRPKSPSPAKILQSTSRSKCQNAGAFGCSALPTYTQSDGTPLQEQEVSYGQLWRWAPARLLARDLRFRLCGNGSSCPQSLNWNLQTFWNQMISGNLLPNNSPSVNSYFASPTPDPYDPAWDSEWLLCTKNSSLSICSGKISKQNWLVGNKTNECMDVTKQPNANSAAVGVTICELDDQMDQLCTLIQSARYQIFEANCQLTGKRN